MEQVLLKAGSFVIIIVLGYLLKSFHVFGPSDYKVMTTIAVNVTLPAAVITSFAKFERDDSLFLLAILGFGLNFVMIFFGFLASLRKGKKRACILYDVLPGL